MKNFIIKKVALGLLLAGYTASGAFAATSATTSSTIKGNAPIITSADTTPVDNKYTIKLQRPVDSGWEDLSSTDKLKVGDKVTITFNYSDADGDAAETDWISTTKTKTAADGGASLALVVTINGTSTPVSPIAGYTSVVATTTPGVYEYLIPSEAANKSLDISLTPVSRFGDPYYGTTLTGSIFSSTNTTGPTIPPGCEDGAASGSKCIYPGDDQLVVQIVHTVSGEIYGSSRSTDLITGTNPIIGDSFKYVVLDTSGSTDADVSGEYKGQWSYSGNNSAALGTQDAASTVSPAAATVGATYTIGINSDDVLSTGNSYDAGAQGFNLQVTVSR